MAREVRHEARGPDVLDEDDLEDDGQIYVCRCGLSDTTPLCDGSHNATLDEDKAAVYKYENDDGDDERRPIGGFEFADQ